MEYMISIIVPAYNIAPYIERCLDSIIAQTYKNIEIIVVNDGSTDGTADIINKYATFNKRIIPVHKSNGGVSSARFAGIEVANGDYIGFVDGDDYIEPDMYERLINNAINHNADISHCGYKMVFPDRINYFYNTNKFVLQDKIKGLNDLISGEYIEPGLCNKLYKKELFADLLNNKLVPEDIKINEDLLMNYWLFKTADISVYEDFCPYHYIARKGSASKAAINKYKLWNPLQVAKIILSDVSSDIELVAYRKLIRILINGATVDIRENPQLIKPYRAETRKELRKKLVEIITGDKCGLKLKIMALWAAVWPDSYSWVHEVYLKITKKDRIYSID